MLYSIPGRSVIEITEATAARLATDCKNICCTKEAGGRPERVSSLLQTVPEGHAIFSGDDPLTYDFMNLGAKGLVSVAANIVPDIMVALVNAMLEGRKDDAKAIHDQNEALFSALMGLDTNPVPIKTACSLTTGDPLKFRLPMVPMSDEKVDSLRSTLKDFNLL